DFVTSNQAKTLVGVREDASFRTNLILVNTTEAPLDVVLTFLDSSGVALGTQTLSPQLQPLEMRQIGRVLPTFTGLNGPVTPAAIAPSTPAANGRFAAYASVIDNKTNDPRTIVPR